MSRVCKRGAVGLFGLLLLSLFAPHASAEVPLEDSYDEGGSGYFEEIYEPDSMELDPAADEPLDSDGDGIEDEMDLCYGFDDLLDSDYDGIPDGCDDTPYGEIWDSDSDGDGVIDAEDVCYGFDDLLDSDYDGIPDGCDDTPYGEFWDSDSDGDGVIDAEDVCYGFDDLLDSDYDGIPDGCDDTPYEEAWEADSDGDGVIDEEDLCLGFDDLLDSDADGIPDGCDGCSDYLEYESIESQECGANDEPIDGGEEGDRPAKTDAESEPLQPLSETMRLVDRDDFKSENPTTRLFALYEVGREMDGAIDSYVPDVKALLDFRPVDTYEKLYRAFAIRRIPDLKKFQEWLPTRSEELAQEYAAALQTLEGSLAAEDEKEQLIAAVLRAHFPFGEGDAVAETEAAVQKGLETPNTGLTPRRKRSAALLGAWKLGRTLKMEDKTLAAGTATALAHGTPWYLSELELERLNDLYRNFGNMLGSHGEASVELVTAASVHVIRLGAVPGYLGNARDLILSLQYYLSAKELEGKAQPAAAYAAMVLLQRLSGDEREDFDAPDKFQKQAIGILGQYKIPAATKPYETGLPATVVLSGEPDRLATLELKYLYDLRKVGSPEDLQTVTLNQHKSVAEAVVAALLGPSSDNLKYEIVEYFKNAADGFEAMQNPLWKTWLDEGLEEKQLIVDTHVSVGLWKLKHSDCADQLYRAGIIFKNHEKVAAMVTKALREVKEHTLCPVQVEDRIEAYLAEFNNRELGSRS